MKSVRQVHLAQFFYDNNSLLVTCSLVQEKMRAIKKSSAERFTFFICVTHCQALISNNCRIALKTDHNMCNKLLNIILLHWVSFELRKIKKCLIVGVVMKEQRRRRWCCMVVDDDDTRFNTYVIQIIFTLYTWCESFVIYYSRINILSHWMCGLL